MWRPIVAELADMEYFAMGNGLLESKPTICLCPDDRELEYDHVKHGVSTKPEDLHSFSIVHGPHGGQSTF